MSDDVPAIPSPPTQTVDLNCIPLGTVAELCADPANEIVGRPRTSGRPRRSQFGSSI